MPQLTATFIGSPPYLFFIRRNQVCPILPSGFPGISSRHFGSLPMPLLSNCNENAAAGALPAGHPLFRESGGSCRDEPVGVGGITRSTEDPPALCRRRPRPGHWLCRPRRVNSSPLIHLSMVGRISLLRRFSSVCIPPAVRQGCGQCGL